MTKKAAEPVQTFRTPAVDRAFSLIEFLASNNGAKFAEIVSHLSIPKSSAYNILKDLEQLGYVLKYSDAKYRLTLKFYNLSGGSLDNAKVSEKIRQVSRIHLEQLKDDLGFAVHLGTQEDSNVVYVEKIEADNFIRFDTFVGKRAPLHLTAVGKALLMNLSDDELEQLSTRLDYKSGSERSIKGPSALISEITKFRKAGFAVEDEEEAAGVRCLAAPIIMNSDFNFCVGIIGLTEQFDGVDSEQIVMRIIETSRNISNDMSDL